MPEKEGPSQEEMGVNKDEYADTVICFHMPKEMSNLLERIAKSKDDAEKQQLMKELDDLYAKLQEEGEVKEYKTPKY